MGNFKLSEAGIKILMEHEGFKAQLYNDAGENEGHCTIGYGHLVHKGVCDVKKFPVEKKFLSGITKQGKGKALLATDSSRAIAAVNRNVKVELNQNQFDALVSLVYNIGEGNFSNSTLLRILNSGDYGGASNEFLKWRKSNGKVLPGLVIRRKKEKDLFDGKAK